MRSSSYRLTKATKRLFRPRSTYSRFEAKYRITAHLFRKVWVVRWNLNNRFRWNSNQY